MQKRKIKIAYTDFWPNLIPEEAYFTNLLRLQYDVEIDQENPDILFFSVDYNNERGRDRYKDCLRVFYTGEDQSPNWDECDVAFTFERGGDQRNYRLPLWAMHLDWFNIGYNHSRDQAYLHPLDKFLNKKIVKESHRQFCCFVASQPKGERMNFVPYLRTSYKDVCCAGRVFNNVGALLKGRGDQIEKIMFLRDFKFNIAFENCSSNGYATEKIIQSMFSNCIPIYWGDPNIHLDFNKNSFLSAHEFESYDHLIDELKKLDNDDSLYYNKLSEPWFNNSTIPEFVMPENVLQFLNKFI